MKKRIYRYGKSIMLALIMSVSSVFVGCSDEFFGDGEAKENLIRFNISTTQMENALSRSRALASGEKQNNVLATDCLLYTSPSPRDRG